MPNVDADDGLVNTPESKGEFRVSPSESFTNNGEMVSRPIEHKHRLHKYIGFSHTILPFRL